jgi:hypothetical protein
VPLCVCDQLLYHRSYGMTVVTGEAAFMVSLADGPTRPTAPAPKRPRGLLQDSLGAFCRVEATWVAVAPKTSQ